MRKLLLSSLAFLFATIPIFAQFSGSGTGTANDPYLIYNEIQLAQVANFNGQGGVVFKLMKDLNVSAYISENFPSQGWQPIGVSSSPFKGIFDGNGHKISGLFINRSTAYLGFFGYADGATIKNVKIEATYIKGTGDGVGAVVGYCHNCTITDCFVLLSSPTGITARSSVGGIAGLANLGTIKNCDVYGSINGKTSVGGIIGESNVLNKPITVTSVTYKGNITGTGKVGGIIGSSCCCYISSAFFQGKISNTGDFTGGIEGRKCLGETSNSIAFGDINGVNYVGGTIGASIDQSDYKNDNHDAIDNCTAIGNISGSNYVGGIIGQDLYFTQTNNYYSGNLSGNDYVGGLVGYANQNTEESITYCYSHATITGTNNVGGLFGKIYDTKLTIKSNVAINPSISAKSYVGRIYGSYIGWDVTFGSNGSSEANRALSLTIVKIDGIAQDVVDNLQNGMSIGPTQLKMKANYVSWGWNFDNNWNILETECYPYKKYQAAPPKIESNLVSQATSISGYSVNGGTVYLFYNDREPVSTTCNGNAWSFTTEPLQSGSIVKIYAETSSLKPSYFTTGTVSFSGSGGTEDDPYLIYSAADLQGATKSGYYKLMNDIDLTSWINENSPTTGWPAVKQNGTEATYIDGNGHKVSGLWTNTSDDYTGLFSHFSAGGYIKDLTVEVASGKKVKGGEYTGVLIGRMDGQNNSQIINCSVKGDVQGTKYVGGLAGYLKSVSCTNNQFSGTVSSSGSEAYTGGLVGYVTNMSVKECSASATVSATGTSSCVGGLVGYINNVGIQKSYTIVTVKATGSGSKVGGITGWNNGNINSSFAKGSVTSSGDNSYTGGLSGYNTSKAGIPAISNCYATTNVKGSLYTAGLVGYSYTPIDCCYASGDVNGVMYGAGVVGELDGSSAKITNCVAANNILSLTAQSSWGCRVIGGYKNGAPEPDNSNYALSTMQVSLNGVPQNKTDDNLEGIAKTKAELMKASTYKGIGWIFGGSLWKIDEGASYPYLSWESDLNNIPIVSITLDNTSLTIPVGHTATITATILPQDASNKSLAWTSSNNNVAKVANGVVTAIGQGNATITAKSTDGSNVSASCQVIVVANNDAAIAELQALVDEAQELYDNSTEGDEIGQYAPGSRAALLAVINSVREKINSTMDEATISECMNLLNNAIALFKSQQVTQGEDTSNTLHADALTINLGKSNSEYLKVNLSNSSEIDGVQFDMTLPAGLTITTDEDDDFVVSTTTRTKKLTVNCVRLSNGSYRIILYSSNRVIIAPGEGAIVNIKVSCSENAESGSYEASFTGISLSCVAGNVSVSQDCADFTSPIIINKESTIKGDANGDFALNITDVMTIVNYILDYQPRIFIFANADMDGNGTVNIADVMNVVNLLLLVSPDNAPAMTTTATQDLLRVSPEATSCLLHTTASAQDIMALQMNVALPVGCELVSAKLVDEASYTHKVMTRRLDDNSYNVVVFSTTGNTLRADSPILSLEIEGRDGLICMEGIQCADMSLKTLFSPDIHTVVTGISNIHVDGESNNDTPIYNIGGQRLTKPQRGINIFQGSKVVVK